MISRTDLDIAFGLLESDILSNLITLKMLNTFSDSMTIRLLRDGVDWALISLLPVGAYEWDRKAYPDAEYVVLIDGTSEPLKTRLVTEIPASTVVVKTGDALVRRLVARLPGATKTATYQSYTIGKRPEAPPAGSVMLQSGTPDEGAWRMFSNNGYGPEELQRCFENGARWFGIERSGRLASACFVYQNYKAVWEIAGVSTEPEFRRQGLARQVVLAALDSLGRKSLIPRYQVKSDNTGSIALAMSCGLVEFLRADHFLVPAGERRAAAGI